MRAGVAGGGEGQADDCGAYGIRHGSGDTDTDGQPRAADCANSDGDGSPNSDSHDDTTDSDTDAHSDSHDDTTDSDTDAHSDSHDDTALSDTDTNCHA